LDLLNRIVANLRSSGRSIPEISELISVSEEKIQAALEYGNTKANGHARK